MPKRPKKIKFKLSDEQITSILNAPNFQQQIDDLKLITLSVAYNLRLLCGVHDQSYDERLANLELASMAEENLWRLEGLSSGQILPPTRGGA